MAKKGGLGKGYDNIFGENELEKLEDNNYRIDCTMNLDDFCENFEISVESDNISVGGWVMEECGEIPAVGHTLHFKNLEIKIRSKP